MFLILLLTLCLGISLASAIIDPSLDAQWLEWKKKYGKIYSKSEEEHRRTIWEENVQIIDLHNRGYSEGKYNYTMKMNTFGDMTSTEFRRKMTGLQNQVIKKGKTFQKRQTLDLPKSVDWRKQGYVSPVKMQGFCNSCWAFSAAGALEGQMFRKTGQLVELSVQNLVDCSRGHGNFACIGGRMEYAFNYVRDNGGLNTEESYPYEEQEGPCRYRPENSAVNVKGFVYVPSNEAALMNAVATVGPISAAINMAFESFQFYTGGIYYEPGCTDTFVNHAVLVVGYGFEGEESDGNHYWLIKNSWGRYWGIDGYMKLAKDRNNHCGIATLPSYPSV